MPVVHVEVGHDAQRGLPKAHEDSGGLQVSYQAIVVIGGRGGPHHVGGMHGLHAVNTAQPVGDASGPLMVLGQAVYVVVQGVQPGGCQVAGLAHAAPQHLADPEGPGNGGLVSGQHRADRSAETLGQAERNRVCIGAVGVDPDTLGDRRVEQAGAVKVDGQVMLPGCCDQVGYLVDGLDVPIDGVLQAEEAGYRVVLVGFFDGSSDVFRREAALLVDFEGPRNGTSEGRRASNLVDHDVVVPAGQELVTALAVGKNSSQVGLGARGAKEGSLLAGQSGDPFLEGVDRGVLAVDVVADRGFGHGLTHGRCGLGDGVAAEVGLDAGRTVRGEGGGLLFGHRRRLGAGCVTIRLGGNRMATNGKGLVMGGHDGPLLPDGVVAPILTPFEDDFSVAHDRLVAHAQRVLDEGCVGLAVFGTTGEALSVATREREAALEALVAGGIDPGVMIVGTGVTNLPGTVHLTRHAMELGCRACMVLPPFYFKDPDPEGLFRYFAGLVERIGDDRLRIVLYHIPQVAGVGLPVPLVSRLRAEFPEVVVAIKDSSGDWANTEALFEIDGLTVYPGAEMPLLDALDRGGPGCITATANVNAGPVAEVIRLHVSGDRPAAEVAMEEVRAFRLLMQEYPAIPTQKRLLALRLGDPTWATVRPPFLPADEAVGVRLEERIAEL